MDVSLTFEDLPTEIKLFIFSFFNDKELNDKVTKICKQWRRLCADPFLWKKLEYNRMQKPSDIVAVEVLNRNNFVRHVAVPGIFDWIDNVVQHKSVRSLHFMFDSEYSIKRQSQFMKVFPFVEKLCVDGCDTVGCDVVLNMTDWKMLKCLELSCMSDENVSKYIPLFAERIKIIENLDMEYCFQISNSTFRQLLELQGRNFKYLCVNFGDIDTESYRLLSVSCVKLTCLHLYKPYKLRDSDLVMLTNLKSLEILRLSFGGILFSRNFSIMFKNSKFEKLSQFLFDCCIDLYDYNLEILVASCPKLQHLIIRNTCSISDKGLINLPIICRNLELLELTKVRHISEKCLERVVAQMPLLHCCFMPKQPEGVTRKPHRWFGKKLTSKINKIIKDTKPLSVWDYSCTVIKE